MASGSPSSRRQIPATAAMFASVTANPGTTCAARSANSRTAGNTPSPAAVSGWPSSGTGSGGTGSTISPSIISASRLVASTRSPAAARSSRSASLATASTRCSQLSSTSSSCRPGQVLRQRRGRRIAGPVLQAQRPRHRLGHQRLLPQLVQPDQPHPAGKRPSQLGRGPQRQPGLADPADPGQRHQPGPGQQPPDLGQLTAAADEAGQLRRQIPRYARSRCHHTSAPGISREGPAQALPLNAHVPRHRRCSLLRRKITCDHGRAPGGPAAPVKSLAGLRVPEPPVPSGRRDLASNGRQPL